MARHMLRGLGVAATALALAATACQPSAPAAQKPAQPAAQQPAQPAAQQPAQPAGGQAAQPAQPAAQAQKPAGPTPKTGGTLTMAIAKDITVMNPLVRTFSTDQSVRELMYESLLTTNDKGEIQPNLAEKWEVSPDGMVYTFTMRKGVLYHNGQEMTAEDAKFAMDYTIEPTNGAYGVARLDPVAKVEAPDKYTLKVTLKAPSASFVSVLTDIMAFSVIPKDSVQAGVSKTDAYPPGTGPFKYTEWQPRQRVVFERYDGYWDQKAYLDKIVLRPIEDSTVRITALRSGDVDVVERTPYEWVQQIKDGKLGNIGYEEAPYAAYRQLVFNVHDPVFSNVKMREAVAWGLDKKEIINAAYFGFGTTASQKYPEGHVWFMPNIVSPTLNADKARTSLREAGYNGEPVHIIVEQAQDVQAAVTAAQAQLKRIGMNVVIDNMEYAAQRERIESGRYQFDTFQGSDFYVDPATTYRTELQCEPDLNKRASNFSGYCNKEVDMWLEQLERELDTNKRKELLTKILTQKDKDLPLVPITFAPRHFSFGEKVKGFDTDQDGAFRPMRGGLQTTWLDR